MNGKAEVEKMIAYLEAIVKQDREWGYRVNHQHSLSIDDIGTLLYLLRTLKEKWV